MEFFCGLDVAMDETAVCVVDDQGAVHLEAAVMTDPEALFAVLKPFLARLRRVGQEAGSLSSWLHPELKKTWPAGDLPGDAARARRAVGAAQQDRQGRCARHRPHHAHRLVPPRSPRFCVSWSPRLLR